MTLTAFLTNKREVTSMSARPRIPPPRPPQQPATFAGAEVRGKMRQWKEKLARQYHAFDRALHDYEALSIVEDMIKRSSDKGRRRAFAHWHAKNRGKR
jgi:hypothetical protein